MNSAEYRVGKPSNYCRQPDIGESQAVADPTIPARFGTSRFADHRERVVRVPV